MDGLFQNEIFLLLLAPLAAFLVQIVAGTKLPRNGDWVSTGAIALSLALAVRIFAHVIFGQADPNFRSIVWSTDYIRLGSFHIEMGILLDNLTACMLLVVTLVSTMVHLFSIGYMHGDPRYSRYFAYLSLFSFSMLGLILAHNLIALYIFWELVGLTSYLLIGFWFEKPSAANAAKKAFLTTRVGDVGMFIGILIISFAIGDFTFGGIFEGIAQGKLAGTLLTVAGIGLFFGAVGKSAQMPLHVWLPDAMEGPTPVSALIHAATMVAAGVYLVGRLYPVFTFEAFTFIAVIGTLTALVAATIAIVATDIKKVLAYSTISQLGYMVAALGCGAFAAGLYHLWTHAFFKALLFLGSGSVIHAVHTQEMPEMGGLRRKLPVTYGTMLLATLAIAGVPGLSGFFSKDAILAGALAYGQTYGGWRMVPFVVLLVGAGITAFYMFRLIFMTFAGKPRDEERHHHAHEGGLSMTGPLLVLGAMTVFSVGIPFVQSDWFLSLMKMPTLADAVSYLPGETGHSVVAGEGHGRAEAAGGHGTSDHGAHGVFAITHEAEHAAHKPAMILSILTAGLGILLSYLTYGAGRISPVAWGARLRPLYHLFRNKYYFDELYQWAIVKPVVALAKVLHVFDDYVVDAIVNGSGKLGAAVSRLAGAIDVRGVDGLVNGLAWLVGRAGAGVQRLQTGRVQTYIYGFMGALLVLVVARMMTG